MPDISNWEASLQGEFLTDTMMIGDIYYRAVYCTSCGATGHQIKSDKGGIRKHKSDWLRETHIELSKKYHFELPGVWRV